MHVGRALPAVVAALAARPERSVGRATTSYLALTGSPPPFAEAARGPKLDVAATGTGGAIALRSRF